MKKQKTTLRQPDADADELALLARRHLKRLTTGSWLSVAASVLFIAELAAIALAVTTVLETSSVQSAYRFLFTYIVLAGLRIATELLAAQVISNAIEGVKSDARTKIAAAISEISPFDRCRPRAGELATLIAGHVDALGPYFSRYQPARLRTFIILPIILAVTAYFSWVAAIVLAVTGPLIPVFMALIGSKAREASERQLQEIGSMNGALLDRLQGIATLQVFNAVARTTQELLNEGQRIREKTIAVLRIAFLSSAVLELFAALGVAFTAVYIGFSLLGHFNFGAYGELTLFGGLLVLMIAPEYFRPLREFAAAYHDRAAALAASHEIKKINSGGFLKVSSSSENNGRGEIVVEHAALEIDGRKLLPEFSLRIQEGEHIAIVGPSGSGKSLLLGLIGSLITPARGVVKTNGRIAWLGQKPAFLQGSLAFNLRLYGGSADSEQTRRAIDFAQAGEIVAKLERGYGEILRENASNLSGGEAQRIALARLALSDAPIILADEPTEHLDDETATAVIDGLFEISHGRTLIVASHDPRIVSKMIRAIDVQRLGTTCHLVEDAA